MIRVLYVDDDPWQLEAAKLFFETEHDMEVNCCLSPDDALILCNEFDCVVTDYRMRRMSGADLVKKVRKTSNVPIIVYSAFDEPEIVNAATSAGANKFIFNNPIHGGHHLLTEEIRRLAR